MAVRLELLAMLSRLKKPYPMKNAVKAMVPGNSHARAYEMVQIATFTVVHFFSPILSAKKPPRGAATMPTRLLAP